MTTVHCEEAAVRGKCRGLWEQRPEQLLPQGPGKKATVTWLQVESGVRLGDKQSKQYF